jgi:hypothetical protein
MAASAELGLAAAAADQVGRVRLALDTTLALAKLVPGGGHAARAEALAARMRESLAGTGLTACV